MCKILCKTVLFYVSPLGMFWDGNGGGQSQSVLYYHDGRQGEARCGL